MRCHSHEIFQSKNEQSMGEFERVSVTLQSGADIAVDAWPGSDAAQPLVLVAPGSTAEEWDAFATRITPSYSPVIAQVSSSLELLLLIWEIPGSRNCGS